MHSLRCLRIMQMKTIIILGFVSVSVTFILLLYYNSSHQLQDFESSNYVINKQLLKHLVEPHGKPGPSDATLTEEEVIELLKVKDSRPPLTVARLAKYCNHAHNHMQGHEGLAPAKYRLLSVHSVIRHGDRSPIYRLPRHLSPELSCLTDTSQYSHVSKIVNFPHVMAEQSAKTVTHSPSNSFSRWSLFPSHETCGEGQLTGQGAIQHILNGIHFSERYFHKHRLFSEENWQKKVLIHSTEISRTYQSAIAFAYGFLPKFDIDSLNIKMSRSVSFCEDRVFGIACHCPKIEELRLKTEAECKSEPEVKKTYGMYKRLLSYVSDVLKVSQYSIPSATSLMDGLSGYTCHNKPYPCNTNGSCITAHVLETLWKVIDTKSRCIGRSKQYRTHSRALMHALLYRISRNFNITRSNGSNASFHLYSGHDTTVTPLIMALELEENVWPGYAHMITFELWRDSDSKGDFIRVLQNGKVVTDQVLFCRGKTIEGGMCNFDNFLSYVGKRNLRSFCYATETKDDFI